MDASTTETKKRIRRWAKRPADPNHDANAFLSVRDVHLILRELESYAKRIDGAPGFRHERRFVQRLVEKLRVVKWFPARRARSTARER